nr:MAG TPA: hypothetical protein [Caudoviricetes sp.]
MVYTISKKSIDVFLYGTHVQECPAKNNLKILRGFSRYHLANKKSKKL